MRKIKVTVSGPPGAGKTGVAALIITALEAAGIQYVIDGSIGDYNRERVARVVVELQSSPCPVIIEEKTVR